MKKDDLFVGAVVLAKMHGYDRRSRCKVVRVGPTHSTVKIKHGWEFLVKNEDLKPARITRKALKELGFEETETLCNRGKPVCIEYIYQTEDEWSWRYRIILKDECDQCGPTRMFGGFGIHKVSYVHEVQRVINKFKNQR